MRGVFMNPEEVDPHLTAKIVVSYVRHHRLVPDQLADLITSVHRAIGHVGQPPEPEEVLTPAVSVRRSVHQDHVICLDCGYRGKTLTRHIATRHGLSTDEYRQRWGLQQSSPDGSSIFRAPLDLGEGAWAWSQAGGKGGLATDTCCIDLARCCRNLEDETDRHFSLCVEVQGCCKPDGGRTDSCQE